MLYTRFWIGLPCSPKFLVASLQLSASVLVCFIAICQVVFLNPLVVMPTFIYSCASPIGKQDRIQPLYLGLGCESQATVTHEVCRSHLYLIQHLINNLKGQSSFIVLSLCQYFILKDTISQSKNKLHLLNTGCHSSEIQNFLIFRIIFQKGLI